jgi:hypothetical protein
VDPFQAQYYSEKLVAPGVEPETPEFAASNSDDYSTEAVSQKAKRSYSASNTNDSFDGL